MTQRQERSLPRTASASKRRWRLGKLYLKICLCRVTKPKKNSEYETDPERLARFSKAWILHSANNTKECWVQTTETSL